MNHHALTRILNATREYKLGTSTTLVLIYLFEHRSATLGTLRKELGVTVSAITGLADRMVELQYANRRGSTTDRRVIWLDITEAGEAALKDILASDVPLPA